MNIDDRLNLARTLSVKNVGLILKKKCTETTIFHNVHMKYYIFSDIVFPWLFSDRPKIPWLSSLQITLRFPDWKKLTDFSWFPGFPVEVETPLSLFVQTLILESHAKSTLISLNFW